MQLDAAHDIVLERPGGVARLEPLALHHAEPLYSAVADDHDCWHFLLSIRPRSAADMEAWIAQALHARSRAVEYPFIAIDRRSGRIVGTTRYLDIQPPHRALEIGATLYARDARRTPLNTECKRLLLAHAFEALGCVRVQLKCDSRNEPSRRAIARLGATFEGIHRRDRILPDGYIRDTAYYSITDLDWPAVRDRLDAMLEARS